MRHPLCPNGREDGRRNGDNKGDSVARAERKHGELEILLETLLSGFVCMDLT